jgi:hypothetical protein
VSGRPPGALAAPPPPAAPRPQPPGPARHHRRRRSRPPHLARLLGDALLLQLRLEARRGRLDARLLRLDPLGLGTDRLGSLQVLGVWGLGKGEGSMAGARGWEEGWAVWAARVGASRARARACLQGEAQRGLPPAHPLVLRRAQARALLVQLALNGILDLGHAAVKRLLPARDHARGSGRERWGGGSTLRSGQAGGGPAVSGGPRPRNRHAVLTFRRAPRVARFPTAPA